MFDRVRRIIARVRRSRATTGSVEELQFHLDMEVEAGLRRGLSPGEARRRASLRAGPVSHAIESTREALGAGWLDGAAGDLRHALRALTRTPAFGVIVVLVLAGSVAINTLIFSMLEGVVLRPLPYSAPERLVRIYEVSEDQPKFPMSIARFLDYQAHASSIERMALYTGQDMELSSADGRSEQLTGVAITSDYFTVLGRPPALGRSFTGSELRRGVRSAILSHRLWRDRFRSDPAVVGKAIRLNRIAWTIVGVAPEGLQHVGGEYRSPLQGETVDVWLPLALDLSEGALRGAHFCNAIARIRAGATSGQVAEELGRLTAAQSRAFPKFGVWRARVEPLLSEVTGRSTQVVWLLVAAGGLVLLVACANIAGLCVARAVARRKELSLRRALGANRWQLLRVGLAENLLVGVAGAALGLLLAWAGMPLLRQLLPADFPRAHEISLTPLMAGFGIGLSVLTTLVASLLPTVGNDTVALAQPRVTAGRDARRLRMTLVVGEIALAGVLSAGALFFLRSFQEINARDHGFHAEGVLTFQLALPDGKKDDDGFVARRYDELRAKIAAIPGVSAVGASTNLPWSGYDENTGFGIVGRVMDAPDGPGARYQGASPGYFEAAGMRLLRGRLFDRTRDADGQPQTVIVNDALAARYFLEGDAVGAMIDIFGSPRQIVGVVAGIKDFPGDLDTKPGVWFPFGQMPFRPAFFAVKSSTRAPASLTDEVAAAVHAIDPELPLADVRTLDARAAAALAAQRLALWLFQAFAVLALVLSAAGIYGLLAYLVRQRRKELSIRAALGAGRADLWRMLVGDGLRMAAIGAACCAILVPFGGSLLQRFLFNVTPFDPVTMVAAPAVLLVVSCLACLAPARTATQSNPALALRED